MSFNFNTKDECIATRTGSGLEEKKEHHSSDQYHEIKTC
jgi:hypothetical protein